MAYGQIDNIFQLLLMMQGTRLGVSLQDIQGEFRVSRRTAERMRDVVVRAFGDRVEVVPSDEPVKRWRTAPGTLGELVAVTPEELLEMEAAEQALRREGLEVRAVILGRLAVKLRASMRPRELARMEPDLAALIEAEGLAARPGPRPAVTPEVLAPLRHAFKAMERVRLYYSPRGGGKAGWRTVSPLGLLYGVRHYLVAVPDGRTQPRLYSLPNIGRVEPMAETAHRPPGFDLRRYAAQSFGIFQEQPADIVLRFDPARAADAAAHRFHDDEAKEAGPDGALLVRFRAGGLKELCWHLFTWEPHVEIIEPISLRQDYARMLSDASVRHGAV